MITVKCSRCGEELFEPGGLAFSPPDEHDSATKYHLCKHCWERFLIRFREMQDIEPIEDERTHGEG